MASINRGRAHVGVGIRSVENVKEVGKMREIGLIDLVCDADYGRGHLRQLATYGDMLELYEKKISQSDPTPKADETQRNINLDLS